MNLAIASSRIIQILEIHLPVLGWLSSAKKRTVTLTLLSVVGASFSPSAEAQSITAAPDGTNTSVTLNGNQFDISGGQLSRNQRNLFHSFEQFGLNPNQIANFLSQPTIENIIGRVTGGNASVIDGLIQLSGGNSNLYLVNPAGIIFGANAQLNIPASFSATTANGIQIGDKWWSALGTNDYAALVGTPNALAFSSGGNSDAAWVPGAIVNAGNLAVTPGESITLIGGTVINTGSISAPGGNLNIAAVLGERLVRITPTGSLLSLELPVETQQALNANLQTLTPQSFPQLLTGGDVPHATQIVTNPDGSVRLVGSGGYIQNLGQLSTTRDEPGQIQLSAQLLENSGQIQADGANGGTVKIETTSFLDAGTISATGNSGQGGEIQVNYTGTVIQTASAVTSANGSTTAGEINFQGGRVLTTSGNLQASGEIGGSIELFGQTVQLLAANVDASGENGGGTILVGGDYQGQTQGAVNAQNTLVNHASRLSADARTLGDGGKVIVWSETLTQFAGTIQARGGAVSGDGGFVEVSGKDTLAMAGVVEAGAVNGQAGTLLLDPKNIVIDDPSTTPLFPQFDLIDPNAGGGTGFGTDIVPLSTGNVVVTKPGDNFATDNAGAVYLYNGATGALISTLTGSQGSDRVGGGGITALSNGNYVVSSRFWNNGTVVDAGAVTWGSGTTGISGAVSAANSLVGTRAGDNVGFDGVVGLSNGNYVVRSPNWDNGAVVNAGAVTWGSGTSGITGAVSAANSLVGTRANDLVGRGLFVGGVVALSNGNYVVSSPNWDNGAVVDAGAVTWGSGTSGITGAVSAANSLVGTSAYDQVGFDGVVALSNGNYVVSSPYWNNGAVVDAGAVTWGNGTSGITGAVSAANSLVGTSSRDLVGNGSLVVGFGGVVALSNGNYVVSSPYWDNGAVMDAGAVTWGNGTSGISGEVSAANTLVGTQPDDFVGNNGIILLSNGNYVVSSPYWDNGAVVNAGAVTWGNGTSGISGAVSAANSLVGTRASDFVGGVVALSNGNYVVRSLSWNGNRGAATWGNGTLGISGEVSATNSLVGTQPGDRLGSSGITALSNGNYVVRSPGWSENRGAATWGNGSTGISGEVSADNSLVGTQLGDGVGNGSITTLSNGNYVVRSLSWNGNRGAATWGNGSTGISGEVSADNSLVGTQPGDRLGSSGITALSNGNYVVGSPGWNGNRGAATWGNGSTGISGEVSAANSLVGTQPDDQVGNNGIILLSNGNYVVRSTAWNGNQGAATWGNGSTGRTLDGTNAITPQNSILGRTADADLTRVVEDPVNGTFLVSFLGEGSGRVTVAPTNPTPPTIPSFDPNLFRFTSDPSATVTLAPSTLQQTLSAGTNVVLQANNDITVNRPIISINPNGNGGSLSMQAGRSILVNADIFTDNGNLTLIANETAANGVVNAHRDPGQAVISIAPGVTLNSGTGDTTLILSTADGLTNNASGDITASNITGGTITLTNNRGGINTSTGVLSAESNGAGGTINLNAAGNIITNTINTNGPVNNGGTIRLTSNNGEITTGTLNAIGNQNGGTIILNATGDLSTNNILSTGRNGAGGTINLDSDSGITTAILDASGNTSGGNITLQSAGQISTNDIIASSRNGRGGTINLNSESLITTALLNASGNTNGGNITLDAAGQITTENILSNGITNNGGEIRLTSGDEITTDIISSSSDINGGNITLEATGNITTESIVSSGQNGNSGTIKLDSSGDISTGILSSLSNTNGGDIFLEATGNITTISLFSYGQNENGGNIRLDSGGNITAGILQASGNNIGGNITLQAEGNITSNSILSSGGNGNGGTINLDSGGSINIINDRLTNLSGITSLSSNGNGGDITLNAATSINTGSLPVFSTSAVGDGGNITLNAASGDIEVAGINTEGGGTGGSVDITTNRFFRATDSFPNLNGTTASITTSGVTAGGTIIIRHGGRGITPFKVGDAGTNGTAGAITTGNLLRSQTISPTASFRNTHTQDGIQIISVPGQTLPPPSPPPGSIRPSDSAGSSQDILASLVGDIAGAETSVNLDPLTGNVSYAWRIPGLGDLDTGKLNLQNALALSNLNQAISQIDGLLEQEYEEFLGKDNSDEKTTVEGIRNVLKTISTETGTNPVIVYALSLPDRLELVLVLPEGPPIHKVIPQANAKALQETLAQFRDSISDELSSPRRYLPPAQKLYQWMIKPIEKELESLGIDTLIFCMDAGLRLIPMAALHDGKQFLVEKYSLGSIPSVSLTNSTYQSLKDGQVLAMGASKFQELDSLPAVPTELDMITQQLWSGESFLNEEFTLSNLKVQSRRKPFEIIHLATHADFQPGDSTNSYIQLWGKDKLTFDQLRQLGWYRPPQVELLVLSACNTAVGSVDVELGFAGLAVQAGVKSALASLWPISDEGTLGLMNEFYHHLSQEDVTIKAEALRRTQIAMLKGKVRLKNGQLITSNGKFPLPPSLAQLGAKKFTHPYYWSAFTMIGSPW